MDFPPSPPLAWLPCSPLGSGSFGHVSLALNLHTDSLFAAKSAPPTSSSALLALHNELRLLQSLDSPFVIRCLGADFSSSLIQPVLRHIFLEYMDGGSLADLLRRSGGKLQDEKLVRHYTRAILQGLDYLHKNGIAHCDIKSHNILIGSSGDIKIADFGAARRLSEASSMGQTMIGGSPLWMAPEVMQGLDQGTPADIWSLGCTVVEMLQGRPPWAHITNLAALFLRVGCSEENPPLPESMSSEARDFLLQCLQRDPNARPTAAQLLKHPFLSKLELADQEYNGDAYDLPSPRSTMNFVQSDSESDWGDESIVGSASIHGDFPSPAVQDGRTGGLICEKQQNSELGRYNLDSQEGNWITVRCRQTLCNKERQAPFMLAGESETGETVQAKRGCEVNLECAEFLRRRVG